MKNLEKILVLLAIAVCCLFFVGCDERGSSKSSSSSSNSSSGASESSSVSKQEAEEMRRRINDLESQVSHLDSEKKKVEKERDEARSIAKSRHTKLSIIFCVALGIVVLIVCGFAFMVRATKRAPAKMSSDSMHCPRCGWEHRPEETICKNCKTHF